MKHIFSRTLETTIKKVSLIVSILISVTVGVIVVSTNKTNTIGAYQVVLENVLMLQHLLVYFVITGFLLMVSTISNATGLIASEVHEGTFKLLAAKPNSRTQILAGKILGVIVGEVILLVISLLSYFSTVIIAGAIDGNIIKEMVSYLPAYFLYGVVIILFFTAVSTFLSCIFKRKISAMLPLLTIVVIALGFLPLQRVMTQVREGSTPTILNYVDLNYHFGLIFKFFVDLVSPIKPNRLIGYLTNLFTDYRLDPDVIRQEWGGRILLANNYLSTTVVMIFYSLLALVSYILSFVIIKKKDI
ncbi:MAG TPA: ABC transporter permease subunit [Erysipelotrichaceae bacterium]|jgi:ABC-type transport system involved in multi-copper enzyme maturation permease subunit|nr:ABC transporter permease subunit [Erysipelotrichia bacterium]HPX32285.1 ABC transporter permease subunit [Erysipelotrichaceae bacterium]HQA84796.1 ABC transporter permease subunit [Erysipelotrichaceae bacterium]